MDTQLLRTTCKQASKQRQWVPVRVISNTLHHTTRHNALSLSLLIQYDNGYKRVEYVMMFLLTNDDDHHHLFDVVIIERIDKCTTIDSVSETETDHTNRQTQFNWPTDRHDGGDNHLSFFPVYSRASYDEDFVYVCACVIHRFTIGLSSLLHQPDQQPSTFG